MSVKNEVVYIKADTNVEVHKREVTIGDVFAITCTQEAVTARIKSMKLLNFPNQGSRRCVISVLRVIETIHKELPGVDIETLGVPDVIVTYEESGNPNQFLHVLKIVGVTVITFAGAAFSIMAFNNDVSTGKLFSQLYELFTGRQSNGMTILELTYSIGLVIGILIFFNHFAGKKFNVDPTPMEVEMRLYENDIQTTLVEAYHRKGQEIDVGNTDRVSNHRT